MGSFSHPFLHLPKNKKFINCYNFCVFICNLFFIKIQHIICRYLKLYLYFHNFLKVIFFLKLPRSIVMKIVAKILLQTVKDGEENLFFLIIFFIICLCTIFVISFGSYYRLVAKIYIVNYQ